MPTAYNIETTDEIIQLILNKDYKSLDEYINNIYAGSEETDDPFRCGMPSEMKPTFEDNFKSYNILSYAKHNKNIRVYHILSYAVDIAEIEVIEYIVNKHHDIDIDFRPHGNAYNLLHLSIENWINAIQQETLLNKNKKDLSYYDTWLIKEYEERPKIPINQYWNAIILLLDSGSKFYYASRLLVSYCQKTDDYRLVDLLINKYNFDTYNLYHYSIFWQCDKVFDKLVDDYADKIDIYGITDSSLKLCQDHKKLDICNHVETKLKDNGLIWKGMKWKKM